MDALEKLQLRLRADAQAAAGYTAQQREAYRLLKSLNEAEREAVLCWFCHCGAFIEPGAGSCKCTREAQLSKPWREAPWRGKPL